VSLTGRAGPSCFILFLATLPCDILSAYLTFCDRVVYPVYLNTPQPSGISPLADQQRAGALMWTCITVVYLPPAVILTTRLLAVRNSPKHEALPSASQGIPAQQRDPHIVETA
jgi:cytochrome c oxidase assembly factor CtaG